MKRYPGHGALSWILYDFANTIFSMNVVSTYFALWITVDNGMDDFWVGFANSLSMLMVALTLPILGVLSDMAGRKVPYLIAMTLTSCIATALIGGTALFSGQVAYRAHIALIFFVVANYSYQGGLVFYNALLPNVSSRWSMGKVSGYGVAAGYLGAIMGLMMVEPWVTGSVRGIEVPFLMERWKSVKAVELKTGITSDHAPSKEGLPYSYRIVVREGPSRREVVIQPDSVVIAADCTRVVYWDEAVYDSLHLGEGETVKTLLQKRREGYGRSAAFIPTAILFLLFSLPAFRFIHEGDEKPVLSTPGKKLGLAIGRIREAVIDTGRYPGVRRFLVAKYLYEDAISTVIVFMAVYSVKVMDMENTELVSFFIISTTSAMAGGVLVGSVLDRIGARKVLESTVLAWTICLVTAALISDKTIFWLIGSAIGMCLGATWTSARPFFIELVPERMLGEFFGLYSLSGKLASIVGPLLWGALVYVFSDYGKLAYRIAILSLAIMAFAGLIVLRGVKGKSESFAK